MKKYLFILLSILMLFTLIFSSVAVAADDSVQPMGAYWEGWKVINTNYLGIFYGTWRIGPSGWGPADLQLSNSYTVSNSVTGTIQVSKSIISAAVGYDVTASWQHLASYTVHPPENEKWEIIFREKKYKDLVTQRKYYHLDGQDYWLDEYAYANAYEFASWDYDHRIVDTR